MLALIGQGKLPLLLVRAGRFIMARTSAVKGVKKEEQTHAIIAVLSVLAGQEMKCRKTKACVAVFCGVLAASTVARPGDADAAEWRGLPIHSANYVNALENDQDDSTEAEPAGNTTEPVVDADILELEGDWEYGQFLSNECLTCHKSDGSTDGIPSITQWPEEAFVIAMHEYKNELRPNPVMQMVARRLSNEEIAALAAYFSTLE